MGEAGENDSATGQGDKPAWAHRQGKVFTANGVVTAVDAENGSFSIRVRNGSKMGHQRGREILIDVNDKARIVRLSNGKRTVVALADMSVGRRVSTRGRFIRSSGSHSYIAQRIRLKAT
ncbi:MAG: hypothetical protein FJ000_01560 [Actinobacteria bacterium]|nr:hypothetical protein [Actinomycetota bacterium]